MGTQGKRSGLRLRRTLLLALVLVGAIAPAEADPPPGTFTTFPTPVAPYDATLGPDGNMWFTENGPPYRIGVMSPAGAVIHEYPLCGTCAPNRITTGPDGNLWFTQDATVAVVRITPAGTVTQFAGGGNKNGITAGPDGNVWFTENTDYVAKITPGGVITRYPVTAGANPAGITTGPDGNLWFTELTGSRIGRITPTGALTEFLLEAGTGPSGIVTGPDGNLWFTESNADRIGRITPQGTVTEFSAGITANSSPRDIELAGDGNLWFTEANVADLGRITPGGHVTEFAVPDLDAQVIQGLTRGANGTLWLGQNYPPALKRIVPPPPPTAATLAATGVTVTSATLNATVNPNGSDTDAHFDYGTTAAYGSTAPAGGELDAGSDNTEHAIARTIDGLAPSTTYHFRIVTRSDAGATNGADATFTTPAADAAGGGGAVAEDGSPLPPASTNGGPPQAYLRAPTEIAAGTTTTLSGEGSTPAGALTYRFDLDGSGQYATDLQTARSVEHTFAVPGDHKVGLRVTDGEGRTDTVRRTVHVTAPPMYGFAYTPRDPDVGEQVRFTVRELGDDPAAPGNQLLLDALPEGTLATMSFGDGTTKSDTVGGILVRRRQASEDGDFVHAFGHQGRFKVHVDVNDGNGYMRGLDVLIDVGRKPVNYRPAIETPTSTVEQGSCVGFSNATAYELSDKDVGRVVSADFSAADKIILIKPVTEIIPFGGDPVFRDNRINVLTLASSAFVAGSPFGHLPYAPANFAIGARSKLRQVEATETDSGRRACEQWHSVESALAAINHPYPHNAEAGWREIRECPGGVKYVTHETDKRATGPKSVDLQTTRHTWFSANRWDFGDGTKSGPEGYLPSFKIFHPYDKPGTYDVKLSTTFPRGLRTQLGEWNATCDSKPFNAVEPKGDDRFVTRSTQMKLRVRAHFNRLKVRGLWLTSGGGGDYTFAESDLPGVYESSGPIYVNTRRRGYGYGANGVYDASQDVNAADGVLVVTPLDGPLRVVPDRGEIIGAAHLAWQSNRKQLALGGMPLNLSGTPGLIIPPDGGDGAHDFGVFVDPPASLSAGAPPPRGAAFHVNWAHVVLRESGGGTLGLNIHTPQPLGPNGGMSDQTLTQTVGGTGRTARQRGLLDNVDVEIPPIVLVPGIVGFNGGKLSHHASAKPPWTATGSLSVFGKTIDMSPDNKIEGCPVSGGLGFFEDGGLAKAGAIVRGLNIPLPGAPPISSITDPAFQIEPATSETPLNLFGCVTFQDYPTGNLYQLVGCVGFLNGGGGVSIAATTVIKFCPDQTGSERFALTEHNSTPDPGRPGRRILRGVVLRVGGTLKLGPSHYKVANAYLEYRDSPFAVEARAKIGESFLDGHVTIGAEVFGYFRAGGDWAVGGEGRIRQDLICIPWTEICPSAGIAVLVASRGLGGCATVLGIGIGGSVRFRDGSLRGHFPGCELEDLKRDLGVSIRRLPRYDDMLEQPGDPLAVTSQTETGGVTFEGTEPYSLIVVNGTDRSPIVEVRDPDGKLVLDDTGEPVQGLPMPTPPPEPVDHAEETPPPPSPPAGGPPPQGIIHNDLSSYHDDTVDLRHTTLVLVRAPKRGRYTITTKEGSSPITAISHSNARPRAIVRAGVVGSGRTRMLSFSSRLPVGSSMTIAEEGRNLSRRLAVVKAAKAAAAGARARIARTTRQVQFRPAIGERGRRSLVAVISHGGIPQQRIVLGHYQAPGVPKAGRVRSLRAKRRGNRLVVGFRPARHAKRHVVRLKLANGLFAERAVGPRARRVVFRNAMVRNGATVVVRAIGSLSVQGPVAKRRVAPVKLRIKHFVL